MIGVKDDEKIADATSAKEMTHKSKGFEELRRPLPASDELWLLI